MEVVREQPQIIPKYQRTATLLDLHRNADPTSREPNLEAYKPRRNANVIAPSHQAENQNRKS